LARVLQDNADEPFAAELADAMLREQATKPLVTTLALAHVVRTTIQKSDSSADPDASVRRVFQALRIAVNDEFGALDALWRQLPHCLKPGGRVAVLTFHSGEDRRVKAAFKQGLHVGTYASIAQDVIRASPEEQRANPRSSSAKLRFAVCGSAEHDAG